MSQLTNTIKFFDVFVFICEVSLMAEEILRAKTKFLFDRFPLTDEQKNNSELNLQEIDEQKTILKSAPRRLVLELTNACNLNCIMCGRNSVKFNSTFFKLEWLEKFAPIMDKIEEVSMFGWGEPTVHPQFVEILKWLDKYPVRKNGMRLGALEDEIFNHKVDIIAISLDGATAETNNKIRRGGSFDKIISNLKSIVARKKKLGLERPYMNFVFCAMAENYKELPDLVKVAAEVGLEEVKAVFFTAFSEDMLPQTLWIGDGLKSDVKDIFKKTLEIAEKLGVKIKLPYLPGEDPAGNKFHKDCFVGWRDLFLGSDGYVRPCMSTPEKFFRFDDEKTFADIWNSEEFQNLRQNVNDSEKMSVHCKNCYQSSHCNWNKKESFIQVGMDFAPEWEK